MVNYEDYDYDYTPVKQKSNSSKKKKKNNVSKFIFLFVSTFFIVLIAFLFIARMVTPSVDIPLTSNEEDTVTTNTDNFRRRIDSSLVEIFNDEKNPHSSINDNDTQTPQDDQITEPSKNHPEDDSVSQKKTFEDDFFKDDESDKNQTSSKVQSPVSAPKPIAPVPPVPMRPTNTDSTNSPEVISPTYKVLVGSFATPEEARLQAKEMTSQGYNVTPFIRLINGRYSVQAGSFNDIEKARNTANNLNHYYDGVKILKEF